MPQMVSMVEMLNMVWVTTGLKIKGYAHTYIWDVTGRKHKKMVTVTDCLWERKLGDRRKGGKRDLSFTLCCFEPFGSCILCITT